MTDKFHQYYGGHVIRKARNAWGVYYYAHDGGNVLRALDGKLASLKKIIDKAQ